MLRIMWAFYSIYHQKIVVDIDRIDDFLFPHDIQYQLQYHQMLK